MIANNNFEEFVKPLNILVYIDKEEKSSKSYELMTLSNEFCDRLFNSVQKFLTYFLSQKFTIYSTTLDELNQKAWFDTTKLLIVIQNNQQNEQDYLNQTKNQVIKEFKTKTTNVIILDRKLLSSSTDLQKFEIHTELLKTKIQQKLGDEIEYEKFYIPEVTTHFVYSEDIDLSNKLLDYLSNKLQLKAKLVENLQEIDDQVDFNTKLYLKCLNTTNKLGRNLIISNVTKSTQPIAENSPSIDGLIVISNQQTEGKGRSKNQWLSPEGSISFTYSLSVSINSYLYKCLSFFQHINALATVLAIKKFKNMDKLDLKIKWPNDIYYKSKYKVLGILTNSQFEGNCVKFFIGTGINLSNDKPTYSLKNIAEQEFCTKFSISKEELIAEILNQINDLIRMLNIQGKEKVLDLYYENWMLTDKIIKLENGKEAQILGLDENGYLRVKLLEDGEIVSLYPDSNRFNAMANMKSFDMN